MASTFTRADSNFVQIRFKDVDGHWRSKATQYRKSNPGEYQTARRVAREMSLDERLQRKGAHNGQWERWVEAWMQDKYAGAESTTLKVYTRHWRKIHLWLAAAGVHSPSQISYNSGLAYRQARLDAGGENNTILHELKFLSLVMGEAVRREYAPGNPLIRMGLRKTPPKEKNPWADSEISAVAIASADHKKFTSPDIHNFIRVTFLLGLYQASRLRQCAVPLHMIDLENSRITYWRTIDDKPLTKGNKPFTQPIDPKLLPELRQIVAARLRNRHKTLCDIPELPSLEWRRFLDTLDFKHLCHHGLRVTWITRAATSGRDGQRGVHQAEAKRFVNHGSTGVHQIYQRLNADDVAHVPSALNLPALPPAPSPE